MSVLVVKSVCTVFIFFCLHRVDSYGLRALSPKDAIETMSNASLSGRRMQQLNMTASSSVDSNFIPPPFGVGTNHSPTNHPSARTLPTNHPSVRSMPTSLPSAQSRTTSKPAAPIITDHTEVPTSKPSVRAEKKPTLASTDEPSYSTQQPPASTLKDEDDTLIEETVVDSGQTDDETVPTLIFQGPAFIIGLEINTTSTGEIGRRVLSQTLEPQLHTHLFEELPFKYKLKSVVIEEIESMSLELVRKLTNVEQDEVHTKSHQFVVTATTEFSTNSIPSKSQVANIVIFTQLDVSVFQASNDGVLKSATGARVFPLRTSMSAITSHEEQVNQSALQNYSVLIYVLSALAIVVLIAGSAYYRKTLKQSDKNLVEERSLRKTSSNRQIVGVLKHVNNLTSLEANNSLSIAESEIQDARRYTKARKRSKLGDGVLLIESESASYSDCSLVDHRGLNDQSFACISPTEFAKEIAHEVVNEVIDDNYSCGISTQNSIWHKSSLQEREIDIDTVVADSDSHSDGGKSRKKTKKRRLRRYGEKDRKQEMRMSAKWTGGEKEKENKVQEDREINNVKDEVLFVSTGFETIDGRMLTSTKKDDIFTVASDDDSLRNGRSRCMSPGELADQVICAFD